MDSVSERGIVRKNEYPPVCWKGSKGTARLLELWAGPLRFPSLAAFHSLLSIALPNKNG